LQDSVEFFGFFNCGEYRPFLAVCQLGGLSTTPREIETLTITMKEVLQMCRNCRKVSLDLQTEHGISLKDHHRKNILSDPAPPMPPETSLDIAYERSPLKPQHRSILKKEPSALVDEGSSQKRKKIAEVAQNQDSSHRT
jgi:hypothetical protein